MRLHKDLKEALIFFAITIGLSYFVFWGPIAVFKVPAANFVTGSKGPVWAIILFMLGGFVPSVVGIILTAFYEGKTGVRKLFKKSLQFKFNVKWYCLMLLISLFLGFALVAIYTILGGKFDHSQFWVQLPSLLPLIIVGPLSEEYGWRGFAIKRLIKHINPNLTSLIIGIVWSLWHFPLFHILGSSQYEFNIPFLVFLLTVTSTSFVYTYVYLKTNQSIFSAIFFHWIYTYVIQVVSSTVTRTRLYNTLEFIPALLVAIVMAFLLRKRKQLKPNRI